MYRSTVLLALILLTSTSSAYAEIACPNSPGYVVANFNGIYTTYAETVINNIAVRDAFGGEFNQRKIRYIRYVNPTKSLLYDLLESYRQYTAIFPDLSIKLEYFMAVVIQLEINPLILFESEMAKLDEFRKNFYSLLAATDPHPTTSVFRLKFQNILATKASIIAVAHSQGNFYLNDVFSSLGQSIQFARQQQRLEAIHIATFTNVANGPLTNNTNDSLLNGVRRFVQPAVPIGNVTVPIRIKDILGHSLADTYLAYGYEARQSIKDDFSYALSSLAIPPCTDDFIQQSSIHYRGYYSADGGTNNSPRHVLSWHLHTQCKQGEDIVPCPTDLIVQVEGNSTTYDAGNIWTDSPHLRTVNIGSYGEWLYHDGIVTGNNTWLVDEVVHADNSNGGPIYAASYLSSSGVTLETSNGVVLESFPDGVTKAANIQPCGNGWCFYGFFQ